MNSYRQAPLYSERNYLENSIIHNQKKLNLNTSNVIKTSRNDLISAKKNVRFKGRNSLQQQQTLKKNLAQIHRQQIELKNVENANQLIQSRIEDEDHLLKNFEKFPFGKQNIDISEDVLERYRKGMNYQDQSRILQKFRRQAEELKRQKKSSRQQYRQQNKFENELRNYNGDSEKNKRYLERMKKKMQQQLDQQKRLRQMEERRMNNISATLNGLSSQLQNNSFTLEKGVRELMKKLNTKPKQIKLPARKLPYPDTLDLQLSSQKIPIVIYNDQPFDARMYFSDVYKSTSKVKNDKAALTSGRGDSDGHQIINSILKENMKRLVYLDGLTQDEDS